jgi:hypothetical protein
VKPRTHIAAFITGHSFRNCTGLSKDQLEFQALSGIPPEHWLKYNFPYQETYPYPDTFRIVAASLNNATHYLRSRRPAFRERHREAVAEIFSRYDAVILLAGSSGMELLNNLDLPAAVQNRLHVFAFGPVSRRLPDAASCYIVQGKTDFISRFFHPGAHRRIDCFHMSYLRAPEMPGLFKQFCRQVLHGETAGP